jgi:hypothetical protein
MCRVIFVTTLPKTARFRESCVNREELFDFSISILATALEAKLLTQVVNLANKLYSNHISVLLKLAILIEYQ